MSAARDRCDAIYVAVLPFYREACMAYFDEISKNECLVFAGDRHIDPTIRTAINPNRYIAVKNRVFGGRVLLQTGYWQPAFQARSVILDLNPRSLTAWTLLVMRRLVGRRTVLWGHLHPRAGGASGTAWLRRTMRRISNGTVLYGYDSVGPARAELPGAPVWVAPNSLYATSDLEAFRRDPNPTSILSVGRLVPSKKLDLLVRAFAASGLAARGITLDLVGDGSDRESLQELARSLGLTRNVMFHGHMSEVADLRHLYSNAMASVSSGAAGLSITQSLGFGVPILVANPERHGPEIELAQVGGVHFFDADSVDSLAGELLSLADRDSRVISEESARTAMAVLRNYSAEAMARGLRDALDGREQTFDDEGWVIG